MATGAEVDLIAIVGPTASGKSGLAMDLAKLRPIEIIAADSRTIYKGADIGTAKPLPEERSKVPHWGLDIVEPGESFSAKAFQDFAKHKIEEIRSRNKLPVIVGGTGLYVDSVIYDYSFVDEKKDYERDSLEAKSIEELKTLVSELGYDLPENSSNKRHLVRQIERGGRGGTKSTLHPGALIVGLMPSDEQLKSSIAHRAKLAFDRGVISETQSLIERYGEAALVQTGGIIYKICIQVLKGELTKQDAFVQTCTQEWQYARRQRTWFRRNKDIIWFDNTKKALSYLEKILNT